MIKLAFSDQYIYELPEGHRFPIEKYVLVKEQLVYEGTIEEAQLYDPGIATEEQILKIHSRDYWQKISTLSFNKKELRRIGLPVTDLSVMRARNSVAGTISAARNALKNGLGINLAGGTHHAYADRGEGFCVLNDIAIAAQVILDDQLVKQILVVDLDVHQGNGTAKIFESEKRVFTFSMHGENNYPLKKEKSDLDISLSYQTDDTEYLSILKKELPLLIDRIKPEVMFFQAGVDVLESDKLGKLSLSKAGVKARDEVVINACRNNNIPLVITMGGGYSNRLSDLVEAHCNTTRTALSVFF